VEKLGEARGKITKSLEEFSDEGSGWRLKRCVALDLKIAQYQPFQGRSCIKTPAYCFEWVIFSQLYLPVKDLQRPSKYLAYLGELNFTVINFPLKVTDISKLEHQNPELLVNISEWERGPHPLHVLKQDNHSVDLLLLTDRNEPEKTQ